MQHIDAPVFHRTFTSDYVDVGIVHTYMRIYIHTYIHAYILTRLFSTEHLCQIVSTLGLCIHTYIHTCVYTYMHTYIHTVNRTFTSDCVHTYMHACLQAYISSKKLAHTKQHIVSLIQDNLLARTCIHACIHTYRFRRMHNHHVHGMWLPSITCCIQTLFSLPYTHKYTCIYKVNRARMKQHILSLSLIHNSLPACLLHSAAF
jgi:hypothetical protein